LKNTGVSYSSQKGEEITRKDAVPQRDNVATKYLVLWKTESEV